MILPPKRYIDLTGHLGSLKGSLTPDSRQFEPAPPLWQLPRRAEPSQAITTLFWLWLALTALGCACIAAL